MHTLVLLAAGGLATSLAEYVFHYNLVDLLKDKAVNLIQKLVG